MEDFEEAEPEPDVVDVRVDGDTEVEVEASTGEQVEQDTQESEDVLDLTSILLPDDTFPQGADQFGVMYNKKLLDGWVKQPSACCGAAAVAGAINCLGSMNRKHMCSLNHIDILNIYRTIMTNSIAKKKSSFERCLGGPVDEFLRQLEVDVFSNNLEQSRKRYATSKKEVLSSVKKLVAVNMEQKQSSPCDEGVESDEMSTTCALLDELLAVERREAEERAEQEKAASISTSSTPSESPRTEDPKKEGGEGSMKAGQEEDEELITDHTPALITVIPGKKPWSVKARPKKKKGGKSSKAAAGGGKASTDEEEEGGRLVHNTWEIGRAHV